MTKESRLHNVGKSLFNKWCWENWTATCKKKKMKFDHSLSPYTQKSSKWIKDLNVRLDTIKLLGENIGRTLWHTTQQHLFNPCPRIMEINAQIDKWDLLKLKSFCTIKEMMDKMKRDWEKTFASDVTNKELSLQNLQNSLLGLLASIQTTHSKNGQTWIDISAKRTYR